MEIAALPKSGLKVKGKNASLFVNATDPAVQNSAVILLDKATVGKTDAVVLNGPGEYEIGGIKITGIRGEGNTVYSMRVDNVDILLGEIADLEKLHQKLKEHNILVIMANTVQNTSFVTGLASNAVLLYGDKAQEVTQGFAKETLKSMAKYQTTKEKLPQEMETVLLA